MTTLEQLRAQAPRSFDKTLIDLLAAIQQGHAPIVIPEAPPLEPRGPDVSPVLIKLAAELDDLRSRVRFLEESITALAVEALRDAA